MRNEEDRPIHLPVPFLKEGTVLFVSPDRRPDRKGCLSLADLAASLSPEFRAYFFPGVAAELTAAALYRRLQELAGLGNETGLLYRRDGVLYFHPLPEGVQPKSAKPRFRGFRRGKAPRIEAMPCEEPEIDEESILFSVTERAALEEREALRKEAPEAAREAAREEAQDPRVQAILDAWEKIEREFGITIEDLQVLLGYQVKLSRLSITTSNRIFLTDFDNREVKMDDLTKALYFFFLRHPEGARLKELQDHEPEILRIYSGITGRDDPDKIRESVHNLLDPFANNLNVSLSRIKKAFRDVVGDRIARFYYISGTPAQPRTLPHDRHLVLWAH